MRQLQIMDILKCQAGHLRVAAQLCFSIDEFLGFRGLFKRS